MNSLVLNPCRCVAFLATSLSTTFLGAIRSATFLGAARSATCLGAVRTTVFLLFVILRVTFLPLGRERPADLVLGVARRATPRVACEVLRLEPAVLFLLIFFKT